MKLVDRGRIAGSKMFFFLVEMSKFTHVDSCYGYYTC